MVDQVYGLVMCLVFKLRKYFLRLQKLGICHKKANGYTAVPKTLAWCCSHSKKCIEGNQKLRSIYYAVSTGRTSIFTYT